MSGGTPIEANPARGESALVIGGVAHRVRPTFEALVAAEGELGSLFALVERAAAGTMTIAEVAGLIWHCLEDRRAVARGAVGQAIVETGLSGVMPVVRCLIGQVLEGR